MNPALLSGTIFSAELRRGPLDARAQGYFSVGCIGIVLEIKFLNRVLHVGEPRFLVVAPLFAVLGILLVGSIIEEALGIPHAIIVIFIIAVGGFFFISRLFK